MTVKALVRRTLERIPGAVPLARLTLETIRVCLSYRVTGLAAEGGFFLLLSLPPFVLGLFGGVGYLGNILGPDVVQQLLEVVTDYASGFLTQASIEELLLPTVRDVLQDGRPDLISVGFLFALWSGSRALNVFVDTISIMYGQGDGRGILRQRFLTFGLYTLGIVVAVVLLPLVLLGPAIIEGWLPERLKVLTLAYWPLVLVLSLALLTTLFHIATPRRASWWRNVPGSLLALAIWLLASLVVRSALEASLGGSSIYGPLSTPIVLLIWLYVLAIAILIGAGLNAATRVLWPVELRDGAGTKLANWAGGLFSRRLAARPPAQVDPIAGDRRSRDQQFTKRERSHLAEAIDRELSEGVARPRQGGEPKG
ncbi:YihY/virulence factor BrkB family protein [Intrasporangium calvum]|uniref:YihY/virulence factor BrkB family protein n=1 Tax=Intrasporangium calvum TaxID=53358 RepID=A0ABT5GBV1_9MICO|nr:YihY/virulence factor BrkB family protein [Intrasporangium calvum]MDC5695736.1 YihY/virulence factor BrkB family protein [Intrasporangium calvum]